MTTRLSLQAARCGEQASSGKTRPVRTVPSSRSQIKTAGAPTGGARRVTGVVMPASSSAWAVAPYAARK